MDGLDPKGEPQSRPLSRVAAEGSRTHPTGPPLGEFDLIARYFTRPTTERQGIGDDCALIDVGGQTLAITSDMLLEGVHFLPDVDPEALGHKSLAVNLSDLAAAGAQPRCFLLDLALPDADPLWLTAFSRGLFALAQAQGCTLIGGDTTRAPSGGARRGVLSIAITAIGTVDRQNYRGRSGAHAGDDIWVSGSLGEAALALALRRGQIDIAEPARGACIARMDRPMPRIALGRAVAGTATASIDVSDGLLGDLGHLLERSGVGAVLRWAELPRSAALAGQDLAVQQRCLLAGGDDYELLFTAPPAADAPLQALSRSGAVPLTRIGEILADRGLALLDRDSRPIETTLAGFDHFR